MEKKMWKHSRHSTEQIDLITKYELIRNVPHRYFTYELNVKEFYPDINYESEEIIKLDWNDDNNA
jgi:hypothetical protein